MCVCLYVQEKTIYTLALLDSTSLLRFLINATIETDVSMVDEHN
jgi:hypothetical protein